MILEKKHNCGSVFQFSKSCTKCQPLRPPQSQRQQVHYQSLITTNPPNITTTNHQQPQQNIPSLKPTVRPWKEAIPPFSGVILPPRKLSRFHHQTHPLLESRPPWRSSLEGSRRHFPWGTYMGFFTKTLGFIAYIFLAKKLGPNSCSNQFLFLGEEILKIHVSARRENNQNHSEVPQSLSEPPFCSSPRKNSVWGWHESWKGIGENPRELESALGLETKNLW